MKNKKKGFYIKDNQAFSVFNDLLIGSQDLVNKLYDNFKIIKYDIAVKDSTICNLGYSKDRNQWYCWLPLSALPIFGFGVGSKIIFEDPEGNKELVATNIKEARKIAILSSLKLKKTDGEIIE